MAITKNEVDVFVAGFKKSTESFIADMEEYSQDKEKSEEVHLKDDYSLSDRIEVMIISLSQFAEKSDMKISVGEIGNKPTDIKTTR